MNRPLVFLLASFVAGVLAADWIHVAHPEAATPAFCVVTSVALVASAIGYFVGHSDGERDWAGVEDRLRSRDGGY